MTATEPLAGAESVENEKEQKERRKSSTNDERSRASPESGPLWQNLEKERLSNQTDDCVKSEKTVKHPRSAERRAPRTALGATQMSLHRLRCPYDSTRPIKLVGHNPLHRFSEPLFVAGRDLERGTIGSSD
jgi:hypothetical protein